MPARHPVAELQGRDGDVQVAYAFGAQVGFELMALMAVVGVLDSLIEADGDEQAEADGAHVDEELFPGKDGVVGWVDFHAVRWAPRIDCCGEGSIEASVSSVEKKASA